MSSPTQKRILILTEGLNPLMWARDGAKALGSVAWRGAKGAAKAPFKAALGGAKIAGRAAGAAVPASAKRDFNTVSNILGFKSKAERDREKREQRSFADEKEEKKRAKKEGRNYVPPEKRGREPKVQIENEHKYINNYLLRNNLRSTRVSGLPTVAPNKSSGRFGIVDEQGRPVLIFYPFAPLSDLATANNDIGFVLFTSATKKMKIVNTRLIDSEYPSTRGFITLENSASRVPHHLR